MKLKKNDIFKQLGETTYIYQCATEKKGRKVGGVTIGTATFRIPTNTFFNAMSAKGLNIIRKVGVGFPKANVIFNYNADSPAFIATITARTICREGDTYSKKVGEKIVSSKIQSIALRIVKRVAEVQRKNYNEWAEQMGDLIKFFDEQISKEKNYIEKGLYLPKDK